MTIVCPPHFNPRPLAGATPAAGQPLRRCSISIHAPLRGRLELTLEDREGLWISIHAPLRGRLQATGLCLDDGTISIHAPLRGRLVQLWFTLWFILFQSTPPCGGDRLRCIP